MRVLTLIFILTISQCLWANQDSLWSVWSNIKLADSSRSQAIQDYIWDGFLFVNPDSAFKLAELQYQFGEKVNYVDAQAEALNTQGIASYFLGNLDLALEKYDASYKFFKAENDLTGMANSLNNQGIIYYLKGENKKGIQIYEECLKIRIEQGDREGIAKAYDNMGNLYNEMGNYAKAIELNTKSLKISESINNKHGIASSLNNIGSIYNIQGDHDLALEKFEKAIALYDEIDNDQGKMQTLGNIALLHYDTDDFEKALSLYRECNLLALQSESIYTLELNYLHIGEIWLQKNNLDSAIYYADKGLEYAIALNDPNGESSLLSLKAKIYFEKGDLGKAVEAAEKSYELAKLTEGVNEVSQSTEILYQAYKLKGSFQKALEMYELFIQAEEEISSEANQKAIISERYKYQYEKQAEADSLLNVEEKKVTDAQIASQEATIKANRFQKILLFGGIGGLVLFGVFVISRLRVSHIQRKLISKQKEEVEAQRNEAEKQKQIVQEKNKEIFDSINYAKRIQAAILPSNQRFNEHLKDSFILYRPKDVVAGDFYWIEEKNDIRLFAAADCTGHGVPGAMVSVVCNNALNRSVREFGLSKPGEILDKTREIVIGEFAQSEESVKDGMDIALCGIQGNTLFYAGANNPLWILRDGELIEVKGDKQPVGNFEFQKPFITHEIVLLKGDLIYIFSDGFVDQFGGEKGKKFKAKSLRELFLQVCHKNMVDQKTEIEKAFIAWRGDLEQIDDLCMIGVRFA